LGEMEDFSFLSAKGIYVWQTILCKQKYLRSRISNVKYQTTG